MIELLLYFAIGFIWTEWLEWFCINTFEGKLGKPFSTKEKVIQFCFWPVFVCVFIFNFIKDMIDRQ